MFGVDEGQATQEFHCRKPFGVVQGELKPIEVAQHRHMLVAKGVVTVVEMWTFDVPYAKAVAPRFVHVGRSDALERAADFGLAFRGLGRCIQQPVRGQNEMGLSADGKVGGNVHPKGHQGIDFLLENDGIDHHSVAHHIEGVGTKHPAGDGVEHVLDAVKFQGVARIGSALKPRNDVVIGGQDIDNFAFAFVAPLEAKQHINFHASDWLWPACGRKCSNCGASLRCQKSPPRSP